MHFYMHTCTHTHKERLSSSNNDVGWTQQPLSRDKKTLPCSWHFNSLDLFTALTHIHNQLIYRQETSRFYCILNLCWGGGSSQNSYNSSPWPDMWQLPHKSNTEKLLVCVSASSLEALMWTNDMWTKHILALPLPILSGGHHGGHVNFNESIYKRRSGGGQWSDPCSHIF